VSEDVPGQLPLVPEDVGEQTARAREQLTALEELRRHGIATTLDRVRVAAAADTAAGDALDQAVAAARRVGATWQQIADAVGIARPSAWERWHPRG
jgi:isopropylmalate/homocitrate/citramalate synthase